VEICRKCRRSIVQEARSRTVILQTAERRAPSEFVSLEPWDNTSAGIAL
jgi:hypothetical protein